MNKIEKKAYKWLIKIGIDKNDIKFRGNKTPDFIIRDGRKYEVKQGIGKKLKRILILERQFPSLIEDPNTKLLVFEKKLEIPFAIIPVNRIKKGIKKIGKVSITWKKFNENAIAYRLEISEDIWIKFRKTLMKDDIINDIIAEMIKERIKKFEETKNL